MTSQPATASLANPASLRAVPCAPSAKGGFQELSQIPQAPVLELSFEGDESGESIRVVIGTWGAQGATCSVRCARKIDPQETRELAQARIYKQAFLQQPFGAAEAAISTPHANNPEARARLARTFGRHLEGLLRLGALHPWYGVNFGPAELRALYDAIGIPTGFATTQSAGRTARSTFAAVRAVANVLSLPPEECRVAVEGFGAVAAELLGRLRRWGAPVVAISNSESSIASAGGLPIDALLQARERCGRDALTRPGEWERLPPDELYRRRVDVLVCCGRGRSIDETVAATIEARAMVSAANVPCVGDAETILQRRGIWVLPDFVVSAGGTLGFLGEDEDRFYENDFRLMFERMLRRADRDATSPAALARRTAEDRFDPAAECRFIERNWKDRLLEAVRTRLQGRSSLLQKRREALVRLVNQTYLD